MNESLRGALLSVGTNRVLAPAKINLYLHVLGRRDDGYHRLDSLVAFTDAGDAVSARPGDGLTLSVDGPYAASLGDVRDNLVLKAAELLAQAAGVRPDASITLTKRLPVASGIGGGSTDAAATLRVLSALWKVRIGRKDMAELALRLGADGPVCLFGRPAFMGGIGEEITPFPRLGKHWMVLANPGVSVSTPEIFAARTGPFSAPARFDKPPASTEELAALLETRRNDLAAPARRFVPMIDAALAALAARPGCLLARMSGSGATCFGLFSTEETARNATRRIARAHPRWWVVATALLS